MNNLNKMAAQCRASLEKIDAELLTAPTRRERKVLRQNRRLVADLERWATTRNGYDAGRDSNSVCQPYSDGHDELGLQT